MTEPFWHISVELDTDDGGFVAFCSEYPGAAGEGESPVTAVDDLLDAIDEIVRQQAGS